MGKLLPWLVIALGAWWFFSRRPLSLMSARTVQNLSPREIEAAWIAERNARTALGLDDGVVFASSADEAVGITRARVSPLNDDGTFITASEAVAPSPGARAEYEAQFEGGAPVGYAGSGRG